MLTYLKFDSRANVGSLQSVEGLRDAVFFRGFMVHEPCMALVGLVGILGALELDLEPLHADLEAVHGPDGGLCTGGIIKADKAKAFALVGGPVNEYFGTDHVPKGEEHLHEFGVPKLLGQVVDEQVTSFRATDRTA